jgi:predicted esterase
MTSSWLDRVAAAVRLLPVTGAVLLLTPAARAADAAIPAEGLVLPGAVEGGRGAYRADPVAARLVAGDWKPPHDGDAVTLPDGATRKWQAVRAGKDGWFGREGIGAGYLYLAVPATEEQVLVLEAAGHAMVYVNGEPRAGDPYDHGYVRVPVLLHRGTNDLLFRGGRAGRVRARLAVPRAPALLNTADATLPDLVAGEAVKAEAAVVVLNATTGPADRLAVEAVLAGGEPTRTPLPPLLPLGVRKVAFRIEGPAPKEAGNAKVEVRLTREEGDRRQTLDMASVTLHVVRPGQTHRRTFRSGIDGSVQYYALVPAAADGGRPGLILTLHGAAVEAAGQAACYTRKPGAHVLAPTNRRPFGFDWEDWGRLDALEVLDLAGKQLDTDPRRTYLTGHSMGGHGTWHLGATYPGRFAAIAPSAGWISMASYAGARTEPGGSGPAARLADLLRRPTGPSDTLALLHNYAQEGVYVLHGDRDDNVPVSEARTMRVKLGTFHPDFAYHEQPGAGHWWGNACVDWPPLIDFLQRRKLPAPAEVRQVDFTTASPGVSAWCHWAGIEAQTEQGKFSSVKLEQDPGKRRFAGTTANVARLALDVGHLKPGENVRVELDGQKLADIPWPAAGTRLWFRREKDQWSAVAAPAPSLKGPHRYGPFKEAFRNEVLFVYGTRGTPEENAAALAKARYDAETFWYQGNASVDVVPDTAWQAAAGHDRNVILYGNADTNAAWEALVGDGPVQVRRGTVRVSDREEKGDDLACLCVRPRPGSERALVGLVAATGAPGMRLAYLPPVFRSGVAYPDWVVIGPDVLAHGSAGVRGAGFFGIDWGLESGESAWRPTSGGSSGK